MTTTCSSVAIVKYDLCFFVSETSMKDVVYTSMIQHVLEYEIVLSLMEYMATLITRSICGTLQSLEIDKDISIPGIGRCDQKHVSFDRRLVRYNIT
jgi:hypothetical protein